MNVYVAALASNLARAGVECDVFTRAERFSQPTVMEVESGFRVLHVRAGPRRHVPKEGLVELIDPFVDSTLRLMRDVSYDVLHANYWLSGTVGHKLKHILDVPLVATFHTLDRVKAEAGLGEDPDVRARHEADVVRCADLLLAATNEERSQLVDLYDAMSSRVEIVAPGVDHELFRPGSRSAARRRLGIGEEARQLLFVGRIQALKGADLAVRCLEQIDDPRAELMIVGGPSGEGGDNEYRALVALVRELGLETRVRFLAPQPHDRLADFYRAADVCVVPSHTESFGLVALEAAACGIPVVAANVGGLRTIVDHGVTGVLVEGRSPGGYASAVGELLRDTDRARAMGSAAEAASRAYAWSVTAARLRRLYGDLAARTLVRCS